MENKRTEFKLVFNEKYHIEYLGSKYILMSKPKKVDDGYMYKVKLYEK